MTNTILNDKIIDEEFRKVIEEKKEKGELITTIQRNGRYLLVDGCIYNLHIGDEVIGIAKEVNSNTIVVEWRETSPTTTVMQRIDEFNRLNLESIQESLGVLEAQDGIYSSEHQPFNPILDRMNEFLRTHTIEEWQDAMMHQEEENVLRRNGLSIDRGMPENSFYYRTDNIYSSDTKQHKERKCWVCGKQIYFRECLNAEVGKIPIPHRNNKTECENAELLINKITKEVEKQWESDIVEIACCGCTGLLSIFNNGITIIQVHTHINKNIVYELNDIKKEEKIDFISIRYIKKGKENKSFNNLTPIQFKNLVEKKFIDIEPSALKELLGGSE